MKYMHLGIKPLCNQNSPEDFKEAAVKINDSGYNHLDLENEGLQPRIHIHIFVGLKEKFFNFLSDYQTKIYLIYMLDYFYSHNT